MGEYILATLSTLGLITAAGLSLNHLLTDSNYQVLKREGFVPIGKRKDPAWRILIDKHGSEGHPILGTNIREEKLFEWCEEILMANRSQDLLKLAKKWCTKPKTNRETISETKGDLRPLKEEDKEEWETKVKEYSSFWRFSNDISMRKRGDIPVLKSDLDVSKLKIWCENKNGNYYLGEDTEEFRSLLKWCYVREKGR